MGTPRLPLAKGLFMVAFSLAVAALAAAGWAVAENEPNDSPEQAEPMPPTGSRAGNVSSPDVDYFRITVPEPGLLTVQVSGTGLRWYVLQASDGISVGSHEVVVDTGVFAKGVVVGAGQDYLVSLWSTSATPVSYSVLSYFTTSFVEVQGAGEVEPNGDASNATTLGPSELQGRTSQLFAGDTDWWAVAGLGAGLFELRTNLSLDEVQLLHGSNLTEVQTRTGQSGGLRFLRAVLGPADTTVYVRVQSSRTTDYSVQAAFEPGLDGIQGPDETEPNNERETADSAWINTTVAGRLDGRYEGQDWWYFEVPRDGAVEVSLNTSDLRISIYQAWDGRNAMPGIRTLPGQVLAGFVAPQAGAYWVFVYATNVQERVDYALAITHDSAYFALSGPDEVEPNPDRQHATPLTFGQPAQGLRANLFYDEDWWRVEVPEAGLLTVTVSGMGGEAMNVGLYRDNSSSMFALYSPCGPACPVFTTHIWNSTGVLYLQVLPVGGADVHYTINVTFDPGFGATAGPDELEPNNTPETAQQVELGVPVRAKLNRAMSDFDVFLFYAPSNGYIVIVIDAENASQLAITLVPYGALLEFSSPTLGPVRYAATGGGAVRVSVSAVQLTQNYTLTAFFFADLSELAALEGEVEPNQESGRPVYLEAGTTYAGAVGSQYDPYDYFAVNGSVGDLVLIYVSAVGGGGVRVYFDTYPQPAGVIRQSYAQARDEPFGLLFQRIGAVVFHLEGDGPSGYEIDVTRKATGLYTQGRRQVDLFAAEPDIGMRFEQADQSHVTSSLIHSQADRLFGETVCLSHDLVGGLDGLTVESGQVFEGPENVRYVAFGATLVNVPAASRECIWALALTPLGWDHVPGSLQPAGVAGPDVRALLASAARNSMRGVPALIALWAVTYTFSLGEIEAWGVTRSEALEANDLLASARLEQRVPVPESPPTDQTPGTVGGGGGFSLSSLALAGMVGALMGGLVLVVGAVVMRARQSRSPPPPSFGADGKLVPAPASAGGPGPLTGGPPPSTRPQPPTRGPRPSTPGPPPSTRPLPPVARPEPPAGHPLCARCGQPYRPGWSSCHACGNRY